MRAGQAGREAERRRQAVLVEARAAREFPRMIEAHPLPTELNSGAHDVHIDALRQAIVDSPVSTSERLALYRLLARHSQALVREHRLDTDPFRVPVQLWRSPGRYDRDALSRLARARALKAALDLAIREQLQDGAWRDRWRGIIAWSALTRGLLCEPRLLCAFIAGVGEDGWGEGREAGRPVAIFEVPLTKLGADGTFDAGAADPAVNTNERLDTHLARYHRWSIDPVTHALLGALLGRLEPAARLPEGPSPLEALNHLLEQGGHPPFRDISALVHALEPALTMRRDIALPEALINCVTGRWQSCSRGLPPASAQKKIGGRMPERTAPPEPEESRSPRPSQVTGSQFRLLRARIAALPRRCQGATLARELGRIVEETETGGLAHCLAAWLHDVARHGRVHKSTVTTYFAKIGARLFDAFADIASEPIGADAFLAAYRLQLGDIPDEGYREQVAELFERFHEFCGHQFGWPVLDESLGTRRHQRHVRARCLAYPAFKKALAAAKSAEALSPDHLQLALLLGYRGGLRRSEIAKLQWRDVVMGPYLAVIVRGNRLGANKTDAARRIVHLSSLLKPGEAKLLEGILARRPRRWKPTDPVLAHASGEAVGASVLAGEIEHCLALATGETGWTTHHLRHSAASNLAAAIMRAAKTCEPYSGWSAGEKDASLAALLVNPANRQAAFAGLAAFMGHVHVRETFESYIHLWPEILGEKLDALDPAADAEILDLLGHRRQREAASDNGDLVRSLGAARKGKGDELADLELASDFELPAAPAQPNVEDLCAFLADIEAGEDPPEAAGRNRLRPSEAVRFLKRARDLGQLTTKHGGSRLFSNDPELKRLVPLALRSRREREFSDEVYRRLVLLAGPAPDELEDLVTYALAHSDTKNTGVRFTHPRRFRDFVATLENAGFSRDTFFVGKHLAGRDEDWAFIAAEGLATADLPYPGRKNPGPRAKGYVSLHLEDRKQARRGKASLKHTSPAWRRAIHLLAIMQPWLPPPE